jgi:hypothetical protein
LDRFLGTRFSAKMTELESEVSSEIGSEDYCGCDICVEERDTRFYEWIKLQNAQNAQNAKQEKQEAIDIELDAYWSETRCIQTPPMSPISPSSSPIYVQDEDTECC